MKLPFDLQAVVARVLAWYNAYSERDRRIILGIVIATAASLVRRRHRADPRLP